MAKPTHDNTAKRGGVLKSIEAIGNALPHPAIIFVILTALVVVISYFVAKSGLQVTYYDARQAKEVTIGATNMLSVEGLRFFFNSATGNFTGFAPLGTVLVAMLGVGVAEYSGLINASLKKLLSNVPASLLTAVVVFAGVMSNVASDAGYVVVIPLGAIVFAGAGRHPIAGLAAAFAGVSAGFSANLLVGTLDPLLAGITNEALKASGSDYTMLATGNFYFMFVSTFLLTILGTIVTERIVEPNLGPYTGEFKPDAEKLTAVENKGLRNAGVALVLFALLMAFLTVPQNAVLKEVDAAGKLNLNNFMHSGLIFMILLLFLIPGYVYGKATGKIKNTNDLVEAMTSAMKSMGGYLVLAFFAAQFVAFFGKSNLGTILSVEGAGFLERIGFKGIPLVLGFILISAFINLFMGSASAKWAIMAPIFVPMMMRLGLTPELTQVAFRIGDSSTNIITPLMSYFAMIVVFAKKYEKDSGLGTLISTMLPYSVVFLIGWAIMLIIWMLVGLPLGPGAALYM
ncbi:AbgT family transporter [Proteiniclasticum sp. QWL-01]|nr:AbgT family transporter [Proteiniclasticum sp. QWL-01]WFF72199.1 AbgT family transporter [Proteiniclasticum sp. QWL-01]